MGWDPLASLRITTSFRLEEDATTEEQMVETCQVLVAFVFTLTYNSLMDVGYVN